MFLKKLVPIYEIYGVNIHKTNSHHIIISYISDAKLFLSMGYTAKLPFVCGLCNVDSTINNQILFLVETLKLLLWKA
jgi:hypothetical protein